MTLNVYKEILKYTKESKLAYPAISVASPQTLIAALRGFSDVESDDIIQVSVGGAEHWSGSSVKDRVAGSLAMATYAKEVAKNYPVAVALYTDRCTEDKLASWIEALINLETEEVKVGRLSFFQSRMFDGSSVSLDQNLEVAKRLLLKAVVTNTALEVEIGVVDGEEDDMVGETNEEPYTTTAGGIKTVEALGLDEKGHYLIALTFGSIHDVYKPGHAKLYPGLLGITQQEVGAHFKTGDHPFDLVMHGGSDSTAEEIATAVANGVIKMNVDIDTQYAYTRPVADWMYKNYGGILRVDGEVGIKKQYDPRAWGKTAETGVAAYVVGAYQCLGSDGTIVR